MVESVDTRDLKSLGHCGCAGSSPASSTRCNCNHWKTDDCDFLFCIIHHKIFGLGNLGVNVTI